MTTRPAPSVGDPAPRPPVWLIVATIGLAAALLLMAVTETSLVGHYLIDQGEFISIAGLIFIAGAGVALYRTGRLRASLPFVFPWLLYPVITQGDQVIDNLSINAMRVLTHVLLALLFGAPVAVVALGVRHAATSPRGAAMLRSRWLAWLPGVRMLADGRTREGTALLAAALIGLEMYPAHVALGTLMIGTLVVMLIGVLVYGSRTAPALERAAPRRHQDRERRALILFVAGLVASAGLYFGYKNRPGAYQGSPSYLLDPSQQAAGYRFDRVPVSPGAPATPPAQTADALREALGTYATALDQLVGGYYVVDRNYTYAFHNALFLRSWPVLPNFRAVALGKIAIARQTAVRADAMSEALHGALPSGDPLESLFEDVRAYVAFNFERAVIVERMTAEFERTEAGLQHAAHLYEGEGKLVGIGVDELLRKHASVLAAPSASAVLEPFLRICRAVRESYANRIVGF